MCGRYGRFSRKQRIEASLGLPIEGPEDLGARYNICPGLPDWVIRQAPAAKLEKLHWGLLPSSTRNPKSSRRPINARAETAAGRPMFRELLAAHRCIVPIDGYYEWRGTSSGKVPFWFRLKSGAPLFLAGLWDTWHAGRSDAFSSYLLMTTEPNELAANIHDRMPVLLHARDVPRWLDPALRDAASLVSLLGPYPAAEMSAHPVSRKVSDPLSEGPQLIECDDAAPELWQ